jgi:pyridoxamine 5'-phosphate oxidase
VVKRNIFPKVLNDITLYYIEYFDYFMNQKNSLGLDSCFKDLEDPLALFTIWLAEAEKKEINDPNALSLATTNSKNEPKVRMVLLKGLSSKGFVFYTNLNSPKSNDLKKNPKAEMCFHWKSLQRQIRISGTVNEVSNEEADIYFNSRPYESRIGAWASDQSKVMNERGDFLKKIEEFKKKYNDEKKVPRPKHWSGWCLSPSSIEFWLGDKYRIHERLKYNKVSDKWKKEILYP